MRTGPKALVGLGLPAALRPHALSKGVGVFAFTYGGQAFTFGGATFTYGAA